MTQNQDIPRCYSYIRFSTPEQSKGDSLDRQLKLSREYAEEHGLLLDESLTMKDLGLSAFSGENRTKGVLGEFLKLVRANKIPKSSVLLVESLDRLSREQVLVAFDQFRALISNGLTIVTLTDRIEYREDTLNANIGQLMISLTVMSRAYEESLQKSKRLKAAWQGKRSIIERKKLTRICPAWLTLENKDDSFAVNDERVNLVNRIFQYSLQGKGVGSIAKLLNLENTPAWKSKTGWHSSYIQKILHNRAVLGEFQLHKMDEEKRIPVGEPIHGYFPQIVSDELFYQVQERLGRTVSIGGKNGKISNLFGGLAKCMYCGAPMQFVNKGKLPKGGTYLVCDSARRGVGCHYISVKYAEVEEAFLNYCKELNIEDMLTKDEGHGASILASLNSSVRVIDGKLFELECKTNNLVSALSDEPDKNLQNIIKAQLIKINNDMECLTKDKISLQHDINIMVNSKHNIENIFESIKELYSFMAIANSNELVEIRHKIRNELRQLVARIDISPSASIPSDATVKQLIEMETDFFISEKGVPYEQAREIAVRKIESYIESTKLQKDARTMTIHFRNGNFRTLGYSPDGTNKYQVLVEKEDDTVTSIWGQMRLSKTLQS